MARVVVVGAGLGGLSTAARLGALGHQVTVLEQAGQIGGKLGLLRRDGFGFDTGPSLLTLPAVYRDLFLKTGEPLEDVLSLEPVDPACHYRFPSGLELDVPGGPGHVSRAWADALGPKAGDDWTAFHRRAAQIWDLTRDPFLESPLDGARTLLGLARNPADIRTVAPWLSLRGLGRKYLQAPEQRMFLDRYATYTGSDPRRAPAALATVPFVEHAFGSWYIPGGLWKLGAAVADRAVSHGVKIRTSASVEQVLAGSSRVEGVRLEGGETVPADVVVSGVEAAHLYRDLMPGPEGDAGRRALRRATPSLSGFVMLLALRGRTPGLRHHTVLFPDDYDAEFDHVFGTGRQAGKASPVPDPTIYISAPDDPELRPDDDHEAWFVLVNAPRHDPGAGMDWDAPGLASSYAEKILAVMAARGLDVRDRLLWNEIRTPADLERGTRSTGGSIYGSSSNGARSAFLRPANRGPVPGLFLVGGSSHPGGGLPLVGLSAAIVADLVGRA
ncbi:phytoene desaturase family protein [Kineosporia succinea]|uniref:Phytoene desaturase n=1 Tax=Kineosporia succinea TaxID=84632 RepID=A0ABT9P6H0_9ACTN|nr:phytoene desaturase family protein [Kineosporia succinea]MDP9828279.1 phytoene desaturase [Kineosporia succinea]